MIFQLTVREERPWEKNFSQRWKRNVWEGLVVETERCFEIKTKTVSTSKGWEGYGGSRGSFIHSFNKHLAKLSYREPFQVDIKAPS